MVLEHGFCSSVQMNKSKIIKKNINPFLFVFIQLICATSFSQYKCFEVLSSLNPNPYSLAFNPISLISVKPSNNSYRPQSHVMTLISSNYAVRTVELRIFKFPNSILKTMTFMQENGVIAKLFPGLRWWHINDETLDNLSFPNHQQIYGKLTGFKSEGFSVEMPLDFHLYRKANIESSSVETKIRNIHSLLKNHNLAIDKLDLRQAPDGSIVLYNLEAIYSVINGSE